MLLGHTPTSEEKLTMLGEAARYDLSCACGPSSSRSRGIDGRWIYPAALPSGERVPMLKVLQQSGCERNCTYCAMRQGGPAADEISFAPEELARLFMALYAQRRVFGLFLSSVVRQSSVATMDKMLATTEILRQRHRFRGYIHLKIIPGSTSAQIDQAMALATRVSINIEAPTAKHLAQIAPGKKFDADILAPIKQVHQAISEGQFARSGQTTQFVVGAADETDQQISLRAAWLYQEMKMNRVYYSAFQPVEHTPLANKQAASFVREHRLYQVDFLLRKYGFTVEEIPFLANGQLSLEQDPKTLWALAHPEKFPVEINQASYEELVRVPGIGPLTAKKLLDFRRQGKLRQLPDLAAAGLPVKTVAPFVLLAGRRPNMPTQLLLPF